MLYTFKECHLIQPESYSLYLRGACSDRKVVATLLHFWSSAGHQISDQSLFSFSRCVNHMTLSSNTSLDITLFYSM